MATKIPASTYRPLVGGSGVTVLKWSFPGEQPYVIAFAQQVDHRVPQPVADAVDVIPLNETRPIEIVTAYAQKRGEIDLTLTQLYNQEAWQRLVGLADSQDFVDIARTVAAMNAGIQIVRLVNPPVPNHPPYQEIFFNCVITKLGDDQTLTIDTMLMGKMITFGYTYGIKTYIGSTQKYPTPSVEGTITSPSQGSTNPVLNSAPGQIQLS